MSENKAKDKTKIQTKRRTKKKEQEKRDILIGLLSNPIKKVEQVVKGTSIFEDIMAIALLIVWVFSVSLKSITSAASIKTITWFVFIDRITSEFTLGIAPVLTVVILGTLFYIFSKEKVKFTSMLTLAITVKVPTIIASIISLLSLYSSRIISVTSRATILGVALSTTLVYFAVKALNKGENDQKVFEQFVKLELIYFIIAIGFAVFEVTI